MSRHSKIQLQVLSLYRRFLRVAKTKPGATEYIRHEFRANAKIPRTETIRIEHVLRRSERQLKELSNPGIKSIGVFQPDGESQVHSSAERTEQAGMTVEEPSGTKNAATVRGRSEKAVLQDKGVRRKTVPLNKEDKT